MRIGILGPGTNARDAQYKAGANASAITVQNVDTVTILAGTPVIFAANGTSDGVAVELPSTATGASPAIPFDLVAGIVGFPVAANQLVDATVSGLAQNVRVTLATRASSTGSWASWAALSIGQVLTIETVGNGLSPGATSSAPAPFVAFQSLASGTTQASSFSSAGLTTSANALYALLEVFVRLM